MNSSSAIQILVVDDDAEMRRALKVFLRDHEVFGAANGQHALALLREGLRPHLILLDLKMPVMDGREFRLQQLRSHTLANIPVVVISGEADVEDWLPGLGASAVLKKPFDGAALRAALAEFLPATQR